MDEDPDARSYRHYNAHAATPSIRSFTSFMLQHQNLVANKHAIFYRFDEKEKRDQAIEHFKCFLGFAKPEYFLLKQELTEWERQLKSQESQLLRETSKKEDLIRQVQMALDNYAAASGTKLSPITAEELVTKPFENLELIRKAKVEVDGTSGEYARIRREVTEEHAVLVSKRRTATKQLQLVGESIAHIKGFQQLTKGVLTPNQELITTSQCPFCNQHHSDLEHQANKLDEAIVWLNAELERSGTLPISLEEKEKSIKDEIAKLDLTIGDIQGRLKTFERHDAELSKRRLHYELAVKSKVQVETTLEGIGEDRPADLQEEIKKLKRLIAERKDLLSREHNVEARLRTAEAEINSFMALWGPKFEFEKSFKPINLQFSLTTFDLWHKNPEGTKPEKVFLRSMGSGANWLYSHLTLFLALHRLFCHHKNECLIPPILFLDQPSQVYFPSVLDTQAKFNAEAIASADPSRGDRPIDDDIAAVTNMYSRLVEFCADTAKAEGIKPQIIVTDHADGLTLDSEIAFETLVAGRRWRTRGLIHPVTE